LEDPQLRRFLFWLAAGLGTRARALVTSRFPLVDLADWRNAGHREERLEDLEPEAARALLRGWGVEGNDDALDTLAAPLHYHALSVAVLGSYLGKLWGGDPRRAPTFDRGEAGAADPKAARLNRILTHYAENLPDAERDLLARLSTFPRGVTPESLGFLTDADASIAGALRGCGEVKLLRLLDRLCELGLVFRFDSPQGATFSAHPFLREYFVDLLRVTNPKEIHEVVRARLAPGLAERPDYKPTDPAVVDRYEALIEHTRLAGRTKEAFDLYNGGLGAYRHLGWVLGDCARGLRIVSGFSSDGALESAAEGLPDEQRSQLLCEWGLYARALGDLGTARRASTLAAELDCPTADRGRRNSNPEEARNLSIEMQNQAGIELLAGRLPHARQAAEGALVEAERVRAKGLMANSYAYLAAALGRLGKVDEARRHFAVATRLETRPLLYSLRGVWEAEFTMACGDRAVARAQTQANRALAVLGEWARDQALCDILLGLLDLPGDPAAAGKHLEAARNYASHSGHVEAQLRCCHLAVEIARTVRAFERGQSEAEAGILLADTCGFGHHGIELRLALARIHLAAGEPGAALQRGREALERSVHPDCRYAWGEADGLHLCGVARVRLGEVEPARQLLSAALAKREQLHHTGQVETHAELGRLGK
jgi:hypothetical protein